MWADSVDVKPLAKIVFLVEGNISSEYSESIYQKLTIYIIIYKFLLCIYLKTSLIWNFVKYLTISFLYCIIAK